MNYIRMASVNPFNKILNNAGEHIYSVYSVKIPSLLKVRIDHVKEVAFIEFTAKILKDDYAKLISLNTIHAALNNVSQTCGCEFDSKGMIANAKVLQVDVTRDISLTMSNKVKESLFMSVTNVKKWRPEIRKQNGVDIRKLVKSNSKCRERLSLYCKPTEMELSRNAVFLESLTDPNTLLNYFKGKVRVEYNLSSSYMIKKALKIDDVLLSNVLSSTANPLAEIFNRLFHEAVLPNADSKSIEFQNYKTLNEYLKSLLLKEFGDDVAKAEHVYRHFYSPRSNFRTKRAELVRIRNFRRKMSGSEQASAKIIRLISNQLN